MSIHTHTHTLPANTSQIVGTTAAAGIKKRLLEEIKQGNEGFYLLVASVAPEIVERSIQNRGIFGCTCRITYDGRHPTK
ncbi:hypothetical protein BDV37DRAFT_250386 [Aspergillus pseudonomiae]|uniref:Uncharacterized protein n=1 Tax=Aspergillus pseudonomiae TaxID=1506151 RepID=A0A5N7DAV7_9EURO|nr:uncharacterized protein BDV37DRAFT_250386 [Aspergillus pseudonomiae]KAE8403369.1 hypothetical protein BDV37DRAFT_250386 [Aspergillus pseudonomiae]